MWASRAVGAGGSGGAEASGAVVELGPEVGQAGPVSESREGPPHPSQQQTDS